MNNRFYRAKIITIFLAGVKGFEIEGDRFESRVKIRKRLKTSEQTGRRPVAILSV